MANNKSTQPEDSSAKDAAKKAATRDGFGQGMLKAAEQNPDVYGLCADLTESMRLNEFKKRFPDQYVQVGVAEQNLVGVAAGLALAGKIPFAASFAVFSPGRSWDQVRVSVAYSNLNVKIIGGHAGLATGPDGATHQALEDISCMRVLPNMKVIVPCDAVQAEQAVLALVNDKGPSYLRLSRPKLPIVTQGKNFQLGKSQILRKGKDLTIIACGDSVHDSLKAASILQEQRVSTQVINMHTIKPLDTEAVINAANDTGRILTVEDHQRFGGLGSAVAEVVSSEINKHINPEIRFDMAAVDDTFGESGSGDDLKKKYKIDSSAIVKKASSLLY